MADISRSSFIPKETPGMVPGRVKRRRTFHVFGFLATSLLVGSIALAGGVYFLKGVSESKLETVKKDLAEQSALFRDEDIAEVREFDRKIRAIELLVGDHMSPLKIFAALERDTKEKVQLVDFEYTYDPGTEAFVNINGGTKTFTTLALQERQFDENAILAGVLFSELGTGDVPSVNDAAEGEEKILNTNDVSFGFKGPIDFGDIRYDGLTPFALPASEFTNETSGDAAADESVTDETSNVTTQ